MKLCFFFRGASCYPGIVNLLPRTLHGQADPFASTHWSVVLAAARDDNSREGEGALAELCQTYWAPLYTFVRRRGYPAPDAQDLTQSFFSRLIEHRIYEHSDPSKGKFRSFLLAAMKNFLANARTRDQALRRGGGQVPLPLLEETMREAERSYHCWPVAFAGEEGADRSFERSWAQALVDAAMARVSQGYASEGKSRLFAALRPFIAGSAENLPTHEQMAAALGIPASTVRSHVTRLRGRYREALHAEVRRTVATETDVRAELADLFRVLTGG